MPFPEPERLQQILSGFAGQRVLVLGDLMLDRYLWGDTARISPEAPVPVIEAREETMRLGGAANVANNVQSLGGEPMLVGVTGADDSAQELVRLLRERRISAGWLVADRTRRTTTKTRVLARHQQVVRVDREDALEIEGEALDSTLDRALAALEKATVCIISDYGKGVITGPLLGPVLEEARKRDVPVCVDPKETHFFSYRGVAVITPNQAEAGAALGRRLRDLPSLTRAGEVLLQELGCRCVLITRGEQGMTLFREGAPPLQFPTAAREVFDVTGAGDTVISAYSLSLAAGAEAAEAAAIANHAAGLVIRDVGTSVTTVEALRRSFESSDGGEAPQVLPRPESSEPGRDDPRRMLPEGGGEPMSAERPAETLPLPDGLLSRPDLARLCGRFRDQGRRVVFTNGCFDLIHPGHVLYLAEARALGDLLVVGLNSDSSVRALKGPHRPYLPERARALILLALRSVDLVSIFPEPTPLELIQSVLPDILVKGGDYRPEEVAGREVVEARGGSVRIVPFHPGYSSRSLIQRIREGADPPATSGG